MADYKEWIQTLADYQGGRPHFADQTVESLLLLERMVGIIDPTVVIELGTAHGLSTRLWLETVSTETEIHCVDASFAPLRGSAAALPVDFSRLTLHENWVHDVRLQDLWGPEDTVLLYVDIHSDHQHVLDAIPGLPQGSYVFFDDVWRSNRRLTTQEEKDAFLEEVVAFQIDFMAPKAIWPLSYADYWKRGGFWGFAEVPLLCEWVEKHKVTLHWEKGAKLVWFQWPHDKEEQHDSFLYTEAL